MTKYILIGAAGIAAVAAGYYFLILRTPSYATATVARAPIVQEVSATGKVTTPTTIDLQFQTGGKLAELNAQTGDPVAAGAVLAKLDTSVLNAQLKQARAALSAQKAQLQTLEEGTRPEQIAVTQAQVNGDAGALAQANQSAVDAIKNAYTVSDDAVTHAVDHFFYGPNTNTPKLVFSVSDSQLKSTVESDRASSGAMLAGWAQDTASLSASGDLGGAASNARTNLSSIVVLLNDSSQALSKAIPSDQASQDQLNQWMAGVVAARNAADAASSALTAALSAQTNASSALERDQKNLALERSGSTASVVAAQQAQVDAALASVDALEAEVSQMQLTAPVAGTVTNVVGDVGETVSPGVVVISILPKSKLQIDANVSEDNIGGVKLGQPVRITLDAFNGAAWDGTVASIDPAQTIVGGAVYYKTTVALGIPDERIKPGMTANLWIQTGAASSTLVVPASALKKNGAETYVQILQNGAPVDRSIKTGLESRDGTVEITGGLSEGEQVLVGTQ